MKNLLKLKKELLEQGATIIKNVFDKEDLSEVNIVTTDMINNWLKFREKDKDYWWYKDSSGNEILFRIHGLQKKHEVFLKLINNRKLSKIRKLFYEGPSCYTECALVYKAPRLSVAIPWHTDPVCTPPRKIFNFSIFLDDSTEENGTFEFLPFSHLKVIEGSDTWDNLNERPEGAKAITAKSGDVLIHDVRLYHGSSSTTSNQQRRSIVIEYRKYN